MEKKRCAIHLRRRRCPRNKSAQSPLARALGSLVIRLFPGSGRRRERAGIIDPAAPAMSAPHPPRPLPLFTLAATVFFFGARPRDRDATAAGFSSLPSFPFGLAFPRSKRASEPSAPLVSYSVGDAANQGRPRPRSIASRITIEWHVDDDARIASDACPAGLCIRNRLGATPIVGHLELRLPIEETGAGSFTR